MNRVSDLLELLTSYNRKERFILLTQVVSGESALVVGDYFRAKLQGVIGLPIPESVPFLAMDFHLNWLYGALWEAAGGDPSGPLFIVPDAPSPEGGTRCAVEANQEDIDLILGWQADGRTQLVLVEAKAHSHWNTKQMASKAARLQAILFEDTQVARFVRSSVEVHLVLAGLKLPTKPEVFREQWPDEIRELNNDSQGKPKVISLLGSTAQTRRVGRLGSDGKSSVGGNWHVIVQQPKPAKAAGGGLPRAVGGGRSHAG